MVGLLYDMYCSSFISVYPVHIIDVILTVCVSILNYINNVILVHAVFKKKQKQKGRVSV